MIGRHPSPDFLVSEMAGFIDLITTATKGRGALHELD